MKDVFADRDTARVGLYQSMLQNVGIPCFIRNYNEGGSPQGLFAPTLCVAADEDYPRAAEIVASAIAAGSAEAGPDWVCVNCGAEVPESFDACWQCEASRPPAAPPSEPSA